MDCLHDCCTRACVKQEVQIYIYHDYNMTVLILIRECYRKTSSISGTKSQNFNVSCILLQLSSLNPLKPGVKLRMKM